MRKKHQGPPTESSVEGMRGQVRFLGVHFPELDVAQSEPDGFFTSQGKQNWRQVSRHNQTTRSHSARRGKGWLTETGRDIQHAGPRTDPGQLDEAVSDRPIFPVPDSPDSCPAHCMQTPLL